MGAPLLALGSALLESLTSGIVQEATAAISGISAQVDVRLDTEGLKALRGKQRSAVFAAVNRTAKPVKEVVVANAIRLSRLGNLAKSIGTKTKIYPKGIITVIGPKMSFRRRTKTRKKGKSKGTRGNIRPYLYARLVEKGTVRSRPKPWIKPAWDSHGQNWPDQVRKAIAAELAKILQQRV